MKEEVYSTKSISISQCDVSESFLLMYDQDVIAFKLCDLYLLRKKISEIDILTLFDSDTPDVEIVSLPHCDRFLVIGIRELLEFRELLNGTFSTLQINSAIQRILRRHVFNF